MVKTKKGRRHQTERDQRSGTEKGGGIQEVEERFRGYIKCSIACRDTCPRRLKKTQKGVPNKREKRKEKSSGNRRIRNDGAIFF